MSETSRSRRAFLGAMAASAACAAWPWHSAATGPDGSSGWLFRDVRVVDGTGTPARSGDVLVLGGRVERVERIRRIGRIGDASATTRGLRVVDGGGRVLAPGFIDLHTHGDPLKVAFTPYLAMGVTTVVLGQDGGSPSLPDTARDPGSLAAWMDAVSRAAPDINVATLSGHGALRRRAGIGDGTRRPSDAQLARLRDILRADLRAGAFGLSTGLEYVPGRYAEPRELAALGPVLAEVDAVMSSHMRSEDAHDVRDSIRELVAAAGPARAHVSHLKMVYGKGEDAAEDLLAFLDTLRRPGQPLTADAYPYAASYTGVAILFPEWALPPADYLAVRAAREAELRDWLVQRMTLRGGPDALLFGTGPHAGQTLAQVAGSRGMHFADALLEIGPGGGQAAHFVMDAALQDRLLLDPRVVVASDGSPGGSHPRGAGTFARWLEAFVVKQPRVSLEEAVRKATSLPASILGLQDRGTLREGAQADLVLFDPDGIRARADYVDPTAMAEGIDLVLVNGESALEGGQPTGRHGRMLRRIAA